MNLDLHCLQRQGISGFSRTRVKHKRTQNAVLVSMRLFICLHMPPSTRICIKYSSDTPTVDCCCFTGWLPGRHNAEPTNKRNDKCLYLKNTFQHPRSQGFVNVNYLFWDDEFCKRTKRKFRKGFHYLCERPRQEVAIPTTESPATQEGIITCIVLHKVPSSAKKNECFSCFSMNHILRSTHWNCSTDAIPVCTHRIYFYMWYKTL